MTTTSRTGPGTGAADVARLRALWAPLHERLMRETHDAESAGRVGLRLLGVGPSGVARGMADLEARTRRSVWNVQRHAPFDPSSDFESLNARSRSRGIVERSVYAPIALNQNPLLPYTDPAGRVAPFVSPLLVVDQVCVVLPGADHPSGHFTAWLSTDRAWLDPALEIWETAWRIGRPLSELATVDNIGRRQLDVARLLVQHFTDETIATRLDVSRRTVSEDIRRLFAAVGVSSRAEFTARLAAAPH